MKKRKSNHTHTHIEWEKPCTKGIKEIIFSISSSKEMNDHH